jgi:hypothetical protein
MSKFKTVNLKEQLKEFAIVKFRNRDRAILIEDAFYTAEDLYNSDSSLARLENFSVDLENKYDTDYNITAFRNIESKHDAITALLQKTTIVWEWERVKPKKMTLTEILEVVQDVMECEIEIVEEVR